MLLNRVVYHYPHTHIYIQYIHSYISHYNTAVRSIKATEVCISGVCADTVSLNENY